jgi:hypothetical protein
MATTQIRLAQLTGSVVDLKPSSVSVGTAAASVTHANLEDVLSYYAQAISNIHGNIEFGSQVPGQFNQDIKPDSSGTRTLGVYSLATWGSSSDVWALKTSASTPNNSSVDKDTTSLTFSSGAGVSSNYGDYFIIESNGGDIYYYMVQSTYNSSDSPVSVSFDASKSTSDGSSAITPLSMYYLSYADASANIDTITAFNRAVVSNVSAPYGLTLTSRQASAITLDAAGALDFDAGSTVDIAATSTLDLSGTALTLSGSSLLGLHGAGIDITDDSSNGVGIKSATGGLYLSGGLGVVFHADGDHGAINGGVDFSQAGDGTLFKDNFGSSSSLLGALNTLYSSNLDTAQTKIQRTLTGSWAASHPLGLPVASGDDEVAVDGTFANLALSVGPHQVDVFVNGQLLHSGSSNDYYVSAQNKLKFNFDLVADDLVTIIDKR